jgi:hypothetical protein
MTATPPGWARYTHGQKVSYNGRKRKTAPRCGEGRPQRGAPLTGRRERPESDVVYRKINETRRLPMRDAIGRRNFLSARVDYLYPTCRQLACGWHKKASKFKCFCKHT